ncbi:MAG: DNA topoisomerase IV subunit B, partial [Rickettsiales bacterium]|nr:DNA topoisomerase IV subunit B [Rickettsiales bacterium]
PEQDTLHFPNGLVDFLESSLEGRKTITEEPFTGEADFPDGQGRVEWAVHWPERDECFTHSYCNTIVTPYGGTHENGLRTALTRSLRDYGERVGNRKAEKITADDVQGNACAILSVFIPEPEFQGQTKEKLVSSKATRLVENAMRDRFDHWLSGHPEAANRLLDFIVQLTEERLKRKAEKEVGRKTPVQKLRLPGKLADCTRSTPEGTE